MLQLAPRPPAAAQATLRIGWVGFHREGVAALEALARAGHRPAAVVTLTSDAAGKRSAVADYGAVCDRLGLPLHEVRDINAEESVALLRALELDVLFVIGWSQILRPPALRCARIGVIGAHASLLPHNRGSAPVNWALIRGEPEAGNSLIWLAEGVDAGDIIDQTAFPVTPFDSCETLYDRVAESNRDMILRLLPRLLAGERPRRSQPPVEEPVLPRRRPADGAIDWSGSARRVYDFVRALTHPYPGAFGWLDGRRWMVWRAALLPGDAYAGAPPGMVLGPAVSPVDAACGQVVACGTGAVVLLEVESEDGERLSGRRLSERAWTDTRWTNAETDPGDRGAP
jgi:methionyl-tRNA formyltransferase